VNNSQPHGNFGPFSNHSSSKKIPNRPRVSQSGALTSTRSEAVKRLKSQSMADQKVEMVVKHRVELKFNIKITDLSDLENPFVIYENKKIDDDGYIIFDNLDFNPFANILENHTSAVNPLRILPWLANPGSSLEKRTLKIEVTYLSELVLLRFIHLDRFYPVKYPQIMLEIANNIGQN